jgi:hypothetical protein
MTERRAGKRYGAVTRTWYAKRLIDDSWLNDPDRDRGFKVAGGALFAARRAARVCCGSTSVTYLEEHESNGSLFECGCGHTLHVFGHRR